MTITTNIFDEQQKLFIEYLVSDDELFAKVRNVFDEKYFEKPLQPVVKFINEYFRKYHSTPPVDIIKASTGVELQKKSVDKDQFDFVANEIERFAQDQAMRIAFYESMDDINKSDLTPIFQRIAKVYTVCLDKDLGTELFRDPAKRLIAMQENIDSRSIGWKKLDEILDRVRRGELILFAAGSGGGKSVFLANIAVNHSRQGLNGVYFTLELKEELVSKRMDAIITGIPIGDIFNSIDSVCDTYRKIESEHGEITVKKLPQGATATDMRSYLMEYQLQFKRKPDFICVDYLDLMKPAEKIESSNRFDIDKAISEELRGLFEDYNVYGYTASQLNRDSVGTTQKTQGHIAGGISKINTADAVIAVSRSEEQIDRGEVEIQALKIRNAETVTKPVILYWNSTNLRISDDVQTTAPVKLTELGNKKDEVQDSDTAPSGSAPLTESINALRDIVSMSSRI